MKLKDEYEIDTQQKNICEIETTETTQNTEGRIYAQKWVTPCCFDCVVLNVF